ncbi:Uncharacterised protein [Mycobacteroides abscessus subsp. abscessus]|nr:Uncharacterised protein [Mycobacteroides abscessus subsp. abscessus]
MRGLRQSNLPKKLKRLDSRFIPIDDSLFGLFIPKKDVFRNAKLRNKRQLLVNDDNSFIFTLLNIFKFAYIPFK